jgi:hypothetical protein
MMIITEGNVSQKFDAKIGVVAKGSRTFKAQRKRKIASMKTNAAMIGIRVVKIKKNKKPTTIESHDKKRLESNNVNTGGYAKTTVLKNKAPLCRMNPNAKAPQVIECLGHKMKHNKLKKYKAADKRRIGYLMKNFSAFN